MKYLTYIAIAALFISTVTFHGCDEEKQKADESTFGYIQSKIFDQSCALSGCHLSEKDGTFPQHRLLLSKGKSYQNLLNADPANENALEDGLKRVSAGDPENSFLLHKLHCDNDHHAHDYGTLMPLGRDPLSKGQVEFIEQWITQGAPETGVIDADITLLDDNVSSCDEDFEPLAAPNAGEGYQVTIEPFEIKPDFEREIFVLKEVGNEEPFYVDRFEMKMRRNSHHFLVASFDDQITAAEMPSVDDVRDLRREDGSYVLNTLAQMEHQIFVIASQTPELDYHFPEGVGLKMPPHHKLDVNLHYVNKSTAPIYGACYLNIYKANPATVVHEAKPIFWDNTDLVLPANQKTVVIRDFKTDVPMKVFVLTSHSHKLGERFEIQINGGARNGETVYVNNDWHHPVMKTFDTPIELNPGEGLTMVVTYNNNTNATVRFGAKSTDEMAIIYGYYY
jgi:hypothetical protein